MVWPHRTPVARRSPRAVQAWQVEARCATAESPIASCPSLGCLPLPLGLVLPFMHSDANAFMIPVHFPEPTSRVRLKLGRVRAAQFVALDALVGHRVDSCLCHEPKKRPTVRVRMTITPMIPTKLISSVMKRAPENFCSIQGTTPSFLVSFSKPPRPVK